MLDHRQILSLLPHRFPFLLVDRVLEMEPGRRIVAIKNVTINEPFFQGHFPQFPLMPGVLILEAMAQAWGILVLSEEPERARERNLYFSGIDRARFRRPVVPGDQIRFELELIKRRRSFWRFRGKAYVGDQLVAEAEMLATISDKDIEARLDESLG